MRSALLAGTHPATPTADRAEASTAAPRLVSLPASGSARRRSRSSSLFSVSLFAAGALVGLSRVMPDSVLLALLGAVGLWAFASSPELSR